MKLNLKCYVVEDNLTIRGCFNITRLCFGHVDTQAIENISNGLYIIDSARERFNFFDHF